MFSHLTGHMRHNVVAYVALFFALSGTAIAAKGGITGDQIQDDSLTGADVQNDSLTGDDVLESSLGKVGDADKLDGVSSEDFAQRLFAVVKADGTIARSTPLVQVERRSAGVYVVTFRSADPNACALAATLGDHGNFFPNNSPGFVVARPGNRGEAVVRTHDTAGQLADRGFHLSMTC